MGWQKGWCSKWILKDFLNSKFNAIPDLHIACSFISVSKFESTTLGITILRGSLITLGSEGLKVLALKLCSDITHLIPWLHGCCFCIRGLTIPEVSKLFCKGPDCTYFRSYQPCWWSQLLRSALVVQKQPQITHEQMGTSIKLYWWAFNMNCL